MTALPPPRISIVMPSFNQGRFLGEAIDSVLAQGVEGLELVVIDGGSTDETLSVLRAYEGRLPLVWRSEPDGGLYEALNKAIAAARGEWIGWLNTDDLYAPGVLALVLELTAVPGVRAICGDAELFTRGDAGQMQILKEFAHYHGERLVPNAQNLTIAHLNACFFRRDLLAELGTFDTRYRIAGDRDYLLRLLRLAPTSRHIGGVTCRYRTHADSLTMASFDATVRHARALVPIALYRELMQICDEHLRRPQTPPEVRVWCRNLFAGLAPEVIADDLAQGRILAALRRAWWGLRLGRHWPRRLWTAARARARPGLRPAQ